MGFVFDSLLIIIAQVTCSILGYFTGGFWDSFTIPAVDDVNWVFTGVTATGQFDYYFPGMIKLKSIFRVMGLFFATILAGLAFLKAMIPDFISGEKADHPAATVFRFAMSGILVVNAYGVLGIIQEPLKEMCDQIRGFTKTTGGFKGDLDVNMWETLINATSNNGVFGNIPMLSDGSAILKGLITGGSAGGVDAAQATIAQRASLVLVLICMILVGWLFIKLVLEMIERYVVMGFLFYCAPLAFGFYATTNTSQITKKYMQMMISQYILIMFNFIFLYIFIASFSRIGDVIAGTPDTSTIGGEAIKNAFLGSKTTEDYSGKNVVIFCFVMAAWLRLGARIDEMIQSLGISAARTGAGLGMELGAAVGTTLGAARTVKSGLQRRSNSINSAKRAQGTPGDKGGFSPFSKPGESKTPPGGSGGGALSHDETKERVLGGNKTTSIPPDNEKARQFSSDNFKNAMGEDMSHAFHSQAASVQHEPNGNISYWDQNGTKMQAIMQGNDGFNDPGVEFTGADGVQYKMSVNSDNRNSPLAHAVLDTAGFRNDVEKMEGYSEVTAENAGIIKATHTDSDGNRCTHLFADQRGFSRDQLQRMYASGGVDFLKAGRRSVLRFDMSNLNDNDTKG